LHLQIIKSSNHQIIKSSNHQIIKLTNFQITKSSNFQIIRIIKLTNFQIIKSPNRQIIFHLFFAGLSDKKYLFRKIINYVLLSFICQPLCNKLYFCG